MGKARTSSKRVLAIFRVLGSAGKRRSGWISITPTLFILLLSHRRAAMQEQRCDLATSIHAVIKTQRKAVTILFDSIYIY